MVRHRIPSVLLSVSALALTGFVAPAFAQDAAPAAPEAQAAEEAAPADSGDIVVTAQKRAERLQDVPLAVTAVTADSLRNRQINDTNSLVAAIPSLSYQQGANPTNTSFRIRGVGTALFGQGVESSVSVVVDGVVAVRSAQGFSELADVERVEVLRGPQGTLFGKNASAGVISVTTARPSNTFEARGDVTIAEHNEYRAKGAVSGPLSDTLRASLSGFYSNVQGTTYNIGTRRWVNGSKGWGIRGKLDWDATENLNFLAAAEYRKTDALCCGSTMVSIVNPVLQQLVGPITASTSNRTINEDSDTYANSTSETYSLTGSLDLGGSTITSISAYQHYTLDVNQPIDRINTAVPLYVGVDGTGQPQAYAFWNQNHGQVDMKAVSQELRISNNGKSDLNYVVGAYFMHSFIDRPFDRRRARCTAGTIGQPCATASTVWQSARSDIRLKQDSVALFGQADYRIVGGLRAIGGVRAQVEQGINTGYRLSGTNYVAGDANFPGNTTVLESAKTHYKASDRAITGKAGLQYEFNRNAQVYASYTRGYKGLGFEMEIGADLENQKAVRPEHVNAYEIGFKGRTSDGSLSVAAAIFRADYTDLQVQANRSNATTGVIQFVTTNAGSSRTQGFEIEATLRPTDGFTVNAAVTYSKSRINIDGLNCAIQQQLAAPVLLTNPVNTCYRVAPAGVTTQAQIDALTDAQRRAITPQQNLRDRPLQASPDWRISVSPRYEFPLGGVDAFVQASANFTSAQNFTAEQDPLAVQPAYVIVDASVGFATADKRYSVSLFVKNLFNEHYLTSLGHNSLLSTIDNPYDLVGTYNKDADRYFGATLGFRF
ncbi:TonB-dependent receptor [Novosphingobium flavum]|uniref:TonB-dependent receptor n=1 Tax=Novosphingobium flavum TaxID=1778672 RepID=A0A7X1FR23_9SPHN|nr:TonB-dependent receptor [Novosphingobium flavum]MBC2665410.1 TonB-dependent receptor [Novosphingobium flavum]